MSKKKTKVSKVKPFEEVDRTERYDKEKGRPIYTITIRNNQTGKTELKQEIYSVVGAIHQAGDNHECGHEDCNGASLVWGVRGDEVKDAILNLAIASHHLVAKQESSNAVKGLMESLSKAFAGRKPEDKKASK